MDSFVMALSGAFGVDQRQVKPEAAGLEIDRFDGWRLTSVTQGQRTCGGTTRVDLRA